MRRLVNLLSTRTKRAALPPRVFGRWWRRQSASRQDRFATLGPLVSVMLFLAAIISAFWYLRNEEFERETESIQRDTEITQQQIRMRLIDNQEQLVRIAREIMSHAMDSAQFGAQATTLSRDRPEITRLHWLDADRGDQASFAARGPYPDLGSAVDGSNVSMPKQDQSSAAEAAFVEARDRRQPVYSKPFTNADGVPVIQQHVPLIDRSTFSGVVVAEYSLDALVRFLVPDEVSRRHAISVIDAQDNVLASTVARQPGRRMRPAPVVHDVQLVANDDALRLRGQGYRTSIGLIGNTLFWMVVALSILTGWMLLGTWRHVRRRSQMQGALATEANFRRAMENSMLTGMRAMDMEGRITYVNPAFCAMTGYAETELLGGKPPFPYWPPSRIEENSRLFQQELQGRSPSGGIEIKVMRKDSTLFDSRMYVSPLIDSKGQQTGWMTSMTNITEAKRIRDQLSASHERFTTVLESLDAAVSVLSVQRNELLFANRSYRIWFGNDAGGHALLSGDEPRSGPISGFDDAVESLGGLPTQEITDADSDSSEVFVESLTKWFDVRSRYLQWTDGGLAQMLIATDVTARRNAETLAASQAEKAQVTSRLVTMGEMASSVAHELNQPLTAITNYCNGMVSRVKGNAIERDDLVAALEKTARQAQRAGQIIHRIRAFVKRSEPQRVEADARGIVDDAIELAGIELRRRKVSIQTYVALRLPPLRVDPILIEQVLLNLLKNAADAIDAENLPTARRNIELRVVPRETADEGSVIEFSVTDMGPGLKDEAIARLYESFFSTKPEGMGIGLSLCRSIIESHRGRIRAQNLYNGKSVVGCRFSFTLPVDGARSEALASSPLPHSNPALTS